jgi:hypothetical protein
MLPLLRVLTGGTSGSLGNGCAPYAKFKPATAENNKCSMNTPQNVGPTEKLVSFCSFPLTGRANKLCVHFCTMPSFHLQHTMCTHYCRLLCFHII